MEAHDLAWAAGFFDGEGWANRQQRGVHSRINQAGLDGIPEVLTKFRRIVGVGRVKGPVIVKRAEFERTLGGPLPAPIWPGTMSEELAWAGFFDGEGSTCLDKHRTHARYRVPVLYVPQSADTGVAPELLRLQKAVGGTISGLRKSKPPWKPYRRWRAFTVEKVFLALHLLWPFIGSVKRAQARHAMQVVLAQLDLVHGNPAFGVAGARFCLRGHDKWNARVRPFKGRGKNDEDPMNHLRQCLTCVRQDAKARRNKKRRS